EAGMRDWSVTGSDVCSSDLGPPVDALGLLAGAAGYDDAERWWDDVIEHRRDGVPPFVAIGEAMAAVRAETESGPPAERLDPPTGIGRASCSDSGAPRQCEQR